MAGEVLAAESAADGEVAGARPITFDKPLIARWAFDEQFRADCLDSAGNRNDAVRLRRGNGCERPVPACCCGRLFALPPCPGESQQPQQAESGQGEGRGFGDHNDGQRQVEADIATAHRRLV